MVNISIWITDGCMASSALTLMDAFSIANLWHRHLTKTKAPALFAPILVSDTGEPVTAQGNIRIDAQGSITDVGQTDCIIISPIMPDRDRPPKNCGVLSQWLKKQRDNGALIASVCTGSFILAQTGLLDGKRATTNWQFAALFQSFFPKVKLVAEDILVEDDNIMSTGAASAVNTLAIYLIRRFGSQKLASICAKAMLVDLNRRTQSAYTISIPFRSHGDAQVLKAQKMIEQHFSSIASIDAIARDVGISPRHFKRRFKSATGDMPLKYLQKTRIEAAKTLLETTDKTLEQITFDIGYQDVSSFCRLFKQHTNTSPSAYREKFLYRVL